MTPLIWMETRCATVSSVTSPNWTKPKNCHETARECGFFKDMRSARKHFLSIGWTIRDDDWWCPVCSRILNDMG